MVSQSEALLLSLVVFWPGGGKRLHWCRGNYQTTTWNEDMECRCHTLPFVLPVSFCLGDVLEYLGIDVNKLSLFPWLWSIEPGPTPRHPFWFCVLDHKHPILKRVNAGRLCLWVISGSEGHKCLGITELFFVFRERRQSSRVVFLCLFSVLWNLPPAHWPPACTVLTGLKKGAAGYQTWQVPLTTTQIEDDSWWRIVVWGARQESITTSFASDSQWC